MNSLRKIAAGALAAAMLMSVAACGSANAAGGDNAGQASDANEEWAAATSVADFGSFEDLETAAKEEGALNVIALPHDWSNWGEVIETFKEKYPEIEVTELNPNASSKEEIDAAKTNAGTDAAPDVFDTGLAVASTNTDYFAPYKVQAWDKIPDELKDVGNLTQVDVTNGTIDSGQTGVVFDWTYNQASYEASLESKGVDWEYMTFPEAQVVSYYNQSINKDAPHPAAARLWMEYLYSPEAQNLWLKGGSNPILLQSMIDEGTVDQDILADADVLEGDSLSYTNEDSTRITEWLQENWDATIGN